MKSKPRPRPPSHSDHLEQLKSRGNAARNELVEITISLRTYADELREYCRAHCGRRKF